MNVRRAHKIWALAILAHASAACDVLLGADPSDGGTSTQGDARPHDPEALRIVPKRVSSPVGSTISFIVRNDLRVLDRDDVAWASSAPSVAEIDARGISNVRGAGTTTISATVEGETLHATLTGYVRVLETVTIEPPLVRVNIGESTTLRALAFYHDGHLIDATALAAWSSDTPNVATVAAAGVVRATGFGGANIAATFEGITASPARIEVRVVARELAIHPSTATIAVDERSLFDATALLVDGSTLTVTSSSTWASRDDATVAIEEPGVARGVASGNTVISARYHGLTATATVTVP